MASIASFGISLSACSSNNSTPHAASSGSIQSLVHSKVKHVFVIIQENHTFDNYFGLFPGVAGQTVENLASTTAQADDCVPDPAAGGCQRPFLISSNTQNTAAFVPDAPDITGGSNSRFGQQYAIDGGKMDGFLAENESSNITTTAPTPLGPNPTAAQIQAHNNALNIMTTYDCDTVPYLWYYAKNFTLFDHYFQANTGQSTPGNVQLFAAQFGQTEVAAGKEPSGISTLPAGSTSYTNGLPLNNDNNPPNSQLSFLGQYSGAASQYISVASMPVLLSPVEDTNAVNATNEGLIPDDMALEAKTGRPSISWAWYEEGDTPSDGAPSGTWSPHHTAPLYFDYINNPTSLFGTAATIKDNTYAGPGLITDIKSNGLAPEGVYWVKGGASGTTFPFHPADNGLSAAGAYQGDDDHPGSGSSDHQVSEAYVATLINTIAQSKYWNDSVIILTWDDSGGMYDHFPPTEYGAACPGDTSGEFAGEPCGDGVRLPMLVISPFAKTGVVVHDQSDAGSVSKFIEDVFALPTLASLPDEAAGVKAGVAPADANAMVGDLTGALDINKLNGTAALVSASTATIPGPAVPPTMSCSSLGLTPIASPASVPAGFKTSGDYISNTPAGYQRQLPPPNDDND